MSINLSVPAQQTHQELKPRIMVIGVGGAGGNAVNDMIAANLDGVEFLAVNTDAQALQGSNAPRKVQMGSGITSGLGAGARPDVGSAAAEESLSEIMEHLEGSNMVFIAAGMGGGTGTGGAPVIAKAAREMGILTVGVVTKPFHFEGVHRMRLADSGIEDLEGYVDTLIVIPNQNLFRIANEKTTFADAFRLADEVLYSGVRGVTDLMVMPGMINLDFADIRSIMSEMGKAMMGTGEAEGERRALDAAEAAIANPLLDDTSMKGAKGVLINITGGSDMTLFEVDEAANRIRSEVDEEAYIIFGSAFDGELEGRVRVSVVATGMDSDASKRAAPAVLNPVGYPLSSKIIGPQVEKVEEASDSATSGDEPLIPFRFSTQDTGVSDNVPGDNVPEVSGLEEQPEPTTDDAENPDLVVQPVESAEHTGAAGDETTVPEAAPASPEQREEDSVIDEEASEDAPTEEKAPAETDESDVHVTPTATPSIDAGESFIPPAPATADGQKQAGPSNPFALSDLMNGSSEKPAAVANAPSRSRAGSLLGRIMGAGKSPQSNVQPLDWKNTPPSSPGPVSEAAASPDPAPAPAPAARTTDIPPASPRIRLGGVEQAERIPASDQEEDLLDIPAFLRRQAN